jgi:hypothetical protein
MARYYPRLASAFFGGEAGPIGHFWSIKCAPAMTGRGSQRVLVFRPRAVRNLFEQVQQEHANRISAFAEPTREQLLTIEPGDIVLAAKVPGFGLDSNQRF